MNLELTSIFTKDNKSIKDSGERTEFSTGAVRDMAEGKGRFDLMPLDVLAMIVADRVAEVVRVGGVDTNEV